MIYERIERLCKKQNISIKELEKTAGIGNGTIGKWRVQSPTVSTLDKVAKVLDVPVAKLLSD